MTVRWWGRAAGLTIVAALLAGSMSAAAGGAATRLGAGWELIGRAADGRIVLELALPAGGRFALEYRNSVYGSPAAEHFAVTAEGRIALLELAAADPAVLQEYYGVTARLGRVAAGEREGWWLGPPADPVELDALVVAATRHGERAIVVDGSGPILLWQVLGAAGPQVTLEARRPA